MDAARASGFKSISVDLIYGLPKQTVIGFSRTLDRVIAASPDRVSIYNYAHLPSLFKPQRRILDADMPSADARLQILSLAIRKMTEAGYVYIGMDHFAKPDDELATPSGRGACIATSRAIRRIRTVICWPSASRRSARSDRPTVRT
jgi:oxygen-independent coproporphyrinogen-3 oxidase